MSGSGGLYVNPTIPLDCPDPGVLRDGDRYVLTCTGGSASGGAFPIRTSPDLVHWTDAGEIFPVGGFPTWATGDYWVPEIHVIGRRYVAYFTARATDGQLSIGVATAANATGPWTDSGAPMLHSPSMGIIEANAFFGADETLITNDASWEGAVVEAPWVVEHDGWYYLFYSGNGYASTSYAMGVARATSPLGPYTKANGPILTTAGAWAGPGHGSVVTGPGGDSYAVYHAWEAGHVGGAPGRLVLVDQVQWRDGWPLIAGGPSSTARPMP